LAFEPVSGLGEGLRIHGEEVGASFDAAAEQAGVLQHAQVLGDRRQGHVVWLRHLADGGLAFAELLDDRAARGIRERREDEVEQRIRSWSAVSHYYCFTLSSLNA